MDNIRQLFKTCVLTLCNFYHSGFSDYCLQFYCYIHNVSANMSSSFLQVFVKLRSLHETLNHIFYLIHKGGGHLFSFR